MAVNCCSPPAVQIAVFTDGSLDHEAWTFPPHIQQIEITSNAIRLFFVVI
jgi:hypothetical protein